MIFSCFAFSPLLDYVAYVIIKLLVFKSQRKSYLDTALKPVEHIENLI